MNKKGRREEIVQNYPVCNYSVGNEEADQEERSRGGKKEHIIINLQRHFDL